MPPTTYKHTHINEVNISTSFSRRSFPYFTNCAYNNLKNYQTPYIQFIPNVPISPEQKALMVREPLSNREVDQKLRVGKL